LFILLKCLPGRPWIIVIAFFGILYGWLTTKYFSDYKPILLKDNYPDLDLMGFSKLANFDYLENDIPGFNIFSGSLKVAFIAILETITSAKIADNLTGSRFDIS